MAITLVGAGGFYTRVGLLGGVLKAFRVFHNTTLNTAVDNVAAGYSGDSLRDIDGFLAAYDTGGAGGYNGLMSACRTVAQNTLLDMVNADQLQASNRDIGLALAELKRQTDAAGKTVAACTVSATPAALTPFTGDGQLVVTVLRGDGLQQDNTYAEVATLVCTADGQTGGGPDSASFTFSGDQNAGDLLSPLWPMGSGASLTVPVVTPTANSVLINGNFEVFTVANTPDNWLIVNGAAGTDVLSDAVTFYDGAACVKFTSGTGRIAQAFGTTDGTGSDQFLEPLTSYAVSLWIRLSGAVGSAVFRVALTDGSNAIVNDAQGVANSANLTIPGAGVWTARQAVFRTPRAIPASGLRLNVGLTTALGGGGVLYVDRVSMRKMDEVYAGGPSLTVFSGTTGFVVGDGWNLTLANDRAGATSGLTWQTLMNLFFDTASQEFLLTTSGSPNILDSLIP